MPDKYIVNMTEKTAPEDTNLLIIEDAVDTKKITFANLFKPIKNMIGNLASLTTSHKSTIVGAINELKANNSSRDYSANFSPGTGVTEFNAKRFGNIVFVSFRFKPESTGFLINTVTVASVARPVHRVAFSVGTSNTAGDTAIDCTAYMLPTSNINVVLAGTLPSQSLDFSAVYLVE